MLNDVAPNKLALEETFDTLPLPHVKQKLAILKT
jgi:hypothetical protein